MSTIRRIVVVLTATVLATLAGTTPAFAGPAPLIEPAPAPAGGSPGLSGSSGSLLDGWSQAALVTVAAITVLVLVVAMVSRTRHHHTPSTA